MEECLDALTRLETHAELRGRTPGRVCQVSERNESEPPSRKVQGTQGKRLTSCTKSPSPKTQPEPPTIPGTITVTKETFAEFLNSALDDRNEQRSRNRKRSYRPTGQGQGRPGPSKERPCGTCGAGDHWSADCPKKTRPAKQPENKEGLDSGSASQSI